MQRAVILLEYILDFKSINYLSRYDINEELIDKMKDTKVIVNRGHVFELLDNDQTDALCGKEFEVVGWIDRSFNLPYDFILFNSRNGNYVLANLKGRSDEWPLFAIQDGLSVCSRSRMGSEWSCKLCVKYFNTVCKGRS